jgi:hypothetical protein
MPRRRNAERGELAPCFGRDPLAAPRRSQFGRDPHAMLGDSRHRGTHVVFDHARRRTAGIRRRQRDDAFVAGAFDVAHDAELDDRNHRDLGIDHAAEDAPDRDRPLARRAARAGLEWRAFAGHRHQRASG